MNSWRRVFLILVFLQVSCDVQNHSSSLDLSDYAEIHKSAKDTISSAVEMEQLFDEDVFHFITHIGMPQQPNVWNSEVFFGGRYVLTVQVDVKVNYDAKTVIPVGKPRFFLVEIAKAIKHANGIAEAHSGASWEFDEDDWEKLIAENELDFESIGIQLKSDPVPNFDFYKQQIAKDRLIVNLLSDVDKKKVSSSDN